VAGSKVSTWGPRILFAHLEPLRGHNAATAILLYKNTPPGRVDKAVSSVSLIQTLLQSAKVMALGTADADITRSVYLEACFLLFS
jgi:hypothetical protein